MLVITFASMAIGILILTQSADLQPVTMNCDSSETPDSADYRQTITWYKHPKFFSGMESYYKNGKRDRIYAMKYCSIFGAPSMTMFNDGQWLPYTDLISTFTRGCGGGAALYLSQSDYYNSENIISDRTFHFRCAATDDAYILGDCAWRGYYPSNYGGDINENCPNNGVMRTVESVYSTSATDRKWRFECCTVFNNPYTYPPMTCEEDNYYTNEMDERHDNKKDSYFLSGMDSYHRNSKEDRQFKWKYCKPSEGSYVSEKVLEETEYDAPMYSTCEIYNGGNAAMIRAESEHSNKAEDRQWTFTCGLLNSEEYQLVNCGWTGDLNTFDDPLDFHCPNNGVIRGFESWHRQKSEDRLWKFDCCNIAEQNYEFTNLKGYWSEVVHNDGGAGTISTSITTGTTRTDGQSVTETFSESLSVAVKRGFTFMETTVTATVAIQTANTISSSISQSETTTVSVNCLPGIQYLHQYVMSSDQATVQTNKYRCTNVAYPACLPAQYDCELVMWTGGPGETQIEDPYCNECL